MTVVDAVDTGEVAELADRLTRRFCPPLSADEVRRCVEDVVAEFDDAPVRAFVIVLAERLASDQLAAAAGRTGTASGNGARAPMAAVQADGVR